MGRTQMQVDDHIESCQIVTAPVLDVPARVPYAKPGIVVAVDGAEMLRAAGWQSHGRDPLDVMGESNSTA